MNTGNINVLIPDGYTCRTGTNMGDPDAFRLQLLDMKLSQKMCKFCWHLFQ